MKPSLDEIAHANDFMPSHDEWVTGVPEDQLKKYYFEPRSDYYGSHRIAALKDRTFLVEFGGGCGWYKAKTWNEAVTLRNQLRSRAVMLNKALGG